MSKAALPRRDDLPAVHISPLRASGWITPEMKSVLVAFTKGDEAHAREVRVTHRLFPARGPEGKRGSWSFFICPSCSRRVRTLRLYDGRLVCRHCDGLLARCQMEGRRTLERIERLRNQLYGPKPAKHRRKALEMSLRRALIVDRRKRLGLD